MRQGGQTEKETIREHPKIYFKKGIIFGILFLENGVCLEKFQKIVNPIFLD